MNYILIKSHLRGFAARIGIYKPLKLVSDIFRGDYRHTKDIIWYKHFLYKGDLVFDVGANRGQSSIIFTAIGCKVIAYEPQKHLHNQIRQLCGKNADLTIESIGLGSACEVRKFFTTTYDQVATFRSDWEGDRIGEIEVVVSSLDIQIDKYGLPKYLKVDVEGWESEVFSGLSHSISIISFEYHLNPNEIENTLKVVKMISNLGNYQYNFRECDSFSFILEKNIELNEIEIILKYNSNKILKSGYGDIYCFLVQP